MGVLASIERRLQGAVDKTFARMFGGRVQPAEVGNALQQEANAHTQRQGNRVVAPNRYVVELGATDHATVDEDASRVAHAFTDMLGNYVDEKGWDTFAAVDVSFVESAALHTGQFRVLSQYDPDVSRRDSGAVQAGDRAVHRGMTSNRAAHVPTGGAPMAGFPDEPRDAPRAPYGQPPAQPYARQPQPGYGPPSAPPTFPPESAPRLLIDDGSSRNYPLQRGSNVLGRGQAAAIRLADTSVSRQHADVYFDGTTAIVHDLGSTNGTMVNGAAIQTWQLADGDVIRLGQSTVVFRAR